MKAYMLTLKLQRSTSTMKSNRDRGYLQVNRMMNQAPVVHTYAAMIRAVRTI